MPVANPIATTPAPPSSGGNANAVGCALNSIECLNSFFFEFVAISNRKTLESSVPTTARLPDGETAMQVGLPQEEGRGSEETSWVPSAETSCASAVVARARTSEAGAADASERGWALAETTEELRGEPKTVAEVRWWNASRLDTSIPSRSDESERTKSQTLSRWS